ALRRVKRRRGRRGRWRRCWSARLIHRVRSRCRSGNVSRSENDRPNVGPFSNSLPLVRTGGSVSNEKYKRLTALIHIPPIARIDHRHLMDGDGELPFLKNGTRKERRLRDRAARKLSDLYRANIINLQNSGARYPVDQTVRQMAIEYTHRYASSGPSNQPLSF